MENARKIASYSKKTGTTRYYDIDTLFGIKNIENDITIAYNRVLSKKDNKKLLDVLKEAVNEI
ncbi:MAG: hypothetical protein WAX04_08490 [Oscillospiraceae bacterium]